MSSIAELERNFQAQLQPPYIAIRVNPNPDRADRQRTLGHPACVWSVSPVDRTIISPAPAADALIECLKYRTNTWGNRLEGMIRRGVNLLSDANGTLQARSQPGHQLEQLPRLYTDGDFLKIVAGQTGDVRTGPAWLKDTEHWLQGNRSETALAANALHQHLQFTRSRENRRALAHPGALARPDTAELEYGVQLSPPADLLAILCLLEHYPKHQAWIQHAGLLSKASLDSIEKLGSTPEEKDQPDPIEHFRRENNMITAADLLHAAMQQNNNQYASALNCAAGDPRLNPDPAVVAQAREILERQRREPELELAGDTELRQRTFRRAIAQANKESIKLPARYSAPPRSPCARPKVASWESPA